MKGIITDFFEDKGFGFIKDETEQKRFFHISNIKDKNVFLANIEDFYFTDWIERRCYIIDFNASENEKGLCALNIELTDQILMIKLIQKNIRQLLLMSSIINNP